MLIIVDLKVPRIDYFLKIFTYQVSHSYLQSFTINRYKINIPLKFSDGRLNVNLYLIKILL